MAKSQPNKYEVVKTVRHDGERVEPGNVIEIESEFTAKTLQARGYIKPAGAKKAASSDTPATTDDGKTPDPGTPGNPATPDPSMVPAAMKENDPGSDKVDTSNAQ